MTTDPTIADLFEAAGYGRPGNDIDDFILWLFVEREWLWKTYVPDLLAVAFGRGLAPYERRVNRLRKAAIRHRRNEREYDKLTDKLVARCEDYRAEREAARDAVDVERKRADGLWEELGGQKLLAQGALAALEEARAELKEYEITRSKGQEWLAHIKVQDAKLQRQGDDLRRLQYSNDLACGDVTRLELKLILAKDRARQASEELQKVEPDIRAAIKILKGP